VVPCPERQKEFPGKEPLEVVSGEKIDVDRPRVHSLHRPRCRSLVHVERTRSELPHKWESANSGPSQWEMVLPITPQSRIPHNVGVDTQHTLVAGRNRLQREGRPGRG
jgi:hypothetical protein